MWRLALSSADDVPVKYLSEHATDICCVVKALTDLWPLTTILQPYFGHCEMEAFPRGYEKQQHHLGTGFAFLGPENLLITPGMGFPSIASSSEQSKMECREAEACHHYSGSR